MTGVTSTGPATSLVLTESMWKAPVTPPARRRTTPTDIAARTDRRIGVRLPVEPFASVPSSVRTSPAGDVRTDDGTEAKGSTGKRTPIRRSVRAAISVGVVRRRAGGVTGAFHMDSVKTSEVAGPVEVTPVIAFYG